MMTQFEAAIGQLYNAWPVKDWLCTHLVVTPLAGRVLPPLKRELSESIACSFVTTSLL
jgi:hypothetical protein